MRCGVCAVPPAWIESPTIEWMEPMLKTVLAAGLLCACVTAPAFAACSADSAMEKASAVSEVLAAKVQTKPDEASKMMNEMGEITGTPTITDQTCAKLDAVMLRAKKL